MLTAIKILHTAVWAMFAACIAAIWVCAWHGLIPYAVLLIGIVCIEVIVLVLNRWHCPLTPIAARYTANRRDNFDIYLPEWLARHNKTIFGALFLGGAAFTFARWYHALP